MSITPSIDPVGQRLITKFYELAKEIEQHQFPAAIVGETTDDGETFAVIRCPHCSAILSEGEALVVIDWSTRLTESDPIYDTHFEQSRVPFSYDENGHFDTLHYQCQNCENAISLPEGWTE